MLPDEEVDVPKASRSYNRKCLIVGETGSGKSGLINLMLGEAQHASNASVYSVTTEFGDSDQILVKKDDTFFNLTAVDSIGVGDFSKDIYDIEKKMNHYLARNPDPIHYIIICMRMGRVTRKTKEDLEVLIKSLRSWGAQDANILLACTFCDFYSPEVRAHYIYQLTNGCDANDDDAHKPLNYNEDRHRTLKRGPLSFIQENTSFVFVTAPSLGEVADRYRELVAVDRHTSRNNILDHLCSDDPGAFRPTHFGTSLFETKSTVEAFVCSHRLAVFVAICTLILLCSAFTVMKTQEELNISNAKQTEQHEQINNLNDKVEKLFQCSFSLNDYRPSFLGGNLSQSERCKLEYAETLRTTQDQKNAGTDTVDVNDG